MAGTVARSWLEPALRALRSLAAPRDASLRRTLCVGTAVGLLCTTLLAGAVVVDCATDLRDAQADLFDIDSFRHVLDTADGLSAERGPANSVMGEEPARASASRTLLADKRAQNDAALADLSARLATWSAVRGGTVGPSALAGIRDRLSAARDAVDGVAALPSAQRAAGTVQRAVQAMFGVVDAFAEVRGGIAQEIMRRHDGIKAQIFEAEMLGDLRDYAGRIASDVMPALAVRQRLATAELVASGRTRGRLGEIWALVGHRGSLYADDAGVATERAAVERMFFGEGLALLDDVIEQGAATGQYRLTPTEFTRRFVPTLAPIERLRTAFLDAWVARSAAASNHAAAMLAVAGLCIGLVMLTLLGLAWSAQRHILAPLLVARDDVIALAEDRAAAADAIRRPRGEMRRLFEAIEILRARIGERALLTHQLRRQADTDLLTGLPNRRALNRAAEQILARPDAGAGTSLIMIDLDHFKAINDRHGHPAGDEALRQVAACLEATAAAGSTVARFGGEEFAVLVPGCELDGAVTTARAMRSALLSRDVFVGGTAVRLTASFGVAAASGIAGDWDDLLARADAELYRAKLEGRDRVSFTAPGTGPVAPGRSAAQAA